MISLVVCSIDSLLYEKFRISIEKTTTIPYQLIKVNNKLEKLPISQAYNKGAGQAKYDFLVFVHEDVIFKTFSWDKKLLEYFNDLEKPGVLGVAGSSYLPISPSDWWVSDSKYLHANFLSNEKKGNAGQGYLKNWGQQIPQSVFALDGMFLAVKKSVWDEFHFDESLDGYHGYDTSICYRVSEKYQNYFVPGIMIEHFSKGDPDEVWLINTIKANASIHSYLDRLKQNSFIDRKLEVKAYHLFLNQLRKFSSSYRFDVLQSTQYLIRNLKYFFNTKLILLYFRFQIIYIFKALFK